jgi:hypothetical protein
MIPETYTEILNKHGRSLQDIGSKDVALPREMVLKAIDALRGSNIAILGIDVIEIKDDYPQYTYDNSGCEREDYGSLEDYRRSSWDRIEQYLLNYPDPLDGTTWYALCVKEVAD